MAVALAHPPHTIHGSPVGVRLDAAVYRRRRVAAAVVLVLLLLVVWSSAVQLAGTWFTDTARATGTADSTVAVVQPGDTLWSIAATIDTDGDVRDTVDLLVLLNGSSALTVGQRLVLPAS
ncbi:MAG: LysM peptidoglycan-binding domain-containing protein [Acidimicrobiia bacterium]|nr:LysM peptidoglycan-binding domain-containing protein [Acidimicrobiia bacterium]